MHSNVLPESSGRTFVVQGWDVEILLSFVANPDLWSCLPIELLLPTDLHI